jgi:ribosomal protein S4E
MSKRMIEKNRTYRIPRGDETDLFHVLEIGSDSLKLKNLKTNRTETVNKSNFQKRLDAGEIYVSANLFNVLRRLV